MNKPSKHLFFAGLWAAGGLLALALNKDSAVIILFFTTSSVWLATI